MVELEGARWRAGTTYVALAQHLQNRFTETLFHFYAQLECKIEHVTSCERHLSIDILILILIPRPHGAGRTRGRGRDAIRPSTHAIGPMDRTSAISCSYSTRKTTGTSATAHSQPFLISSL